MDFYFNLYNISPKTTNKINTTQGDNKFTNNQHYHYLQQKTMSNVSDNEEEAPRQRRRWWTIWRRSPPLSRRSRCQRTLLTSNVSLLIMTPTFTITIRKAILKTRKL